MIPLEHRSWTQHQDSERTLLVPLGSFEQHGPHLPLSTDTLIARALCERVAQLRDVDIAPELPFGASGEHQGFPGLLSLGTEVLSSVLTEILRSARASFGAVVLVSGHGGNVDAVRQALTLGRAEGSRVTAWFPRDPEGDPHAGATETSVMMLLHPELVGDTELDAVHLDEGENQRLRTEGIMGVSRSGILGDPRAANLAYGHEVVARWVAEIVSLVDRLGESS